MLMKSGQNPEDKGLIEELKSTTSSEEMWALLLLLEKTTDIEEIELIPPGVSSNSEPADKPQHKHDFSVAPLEGYTVKEIFL